MTPAQAIEEVRDIADRIFRPRAEATDRDSTGAALRENIRLLAERGYFGLGIDRQYGGIGAGEHERREFTEIIASACGVTGFTQQQLHSGGAYASAASDDVLKEKLLPKFASGEILCGIAFSHLRRGGAPMVTAETMDGGFRVNGLAPWVTGWSLLDGFILGATVTGPSGGSEHSEVHHLFAYVPKAGNEASLIASAPLALHAMNASDTVEVTIRDLFIPEADITSLKPAADLRRADFCGISGHVYHPLGCVRGSIRYLRDLADQRGSDQTARAADLFEHEIDACRREALTWSGACADVPGYLEHALHARTWAIELAVRAAHAAVAATGGTAQMLASPAQRLMREAVFYTTLAQTPNVQSETLDRLTRPAAALAQSGPGTVDEDLPLKDS